ncbi:Obg family GTPase CgtA [Candidatus Omnitrophota bacterium]
MPFIDEASIFIKAGDGGKGCKSLYHDKFLRHPRPDGGDGGKGGDVVVVADDKVHTLLDFKFRQHFKAESGKHGSSNKKKGREGADCIITVPVSTVITDAQKGTILRELTGNASKVIVARGGSGGRGNATVKQTTDNKLGEERKIHLELRLIADAGIVGLPNAGKSTLISCITNAKAKIASYPFTTKNPVLGKITIDDTSITIADLPGLIEGAHQGRGLGDRFLKHVEKTRFLIHLIDIADANSDPVRNFFTLNRELSLYSRNLAQKPQIIVLNKIDIEGSKERIKRFKGVIKKRVYAISALESDGIEALVKIIKNHHERTIS